MTDPYIGKHRSGQGSPGYSRGKREKPGGNSFFPPVDNTPASVHLGVMTAGNMMAYHEHNRQREYHVASAHKNMSKAAHPSAGSRSEEFARDALTAANNANASYGNMRAAGRTTEPTGQMHGRQGHFDLGRRAGFSGLN